MPNELDVERRSLIKKSRLTVLIPAYNELYGIAETICSLRNQTISPDEIIVVDDCSTDGTGDLARSLGVTVIRPTLNTGFKSGACNFGLKKVTTEFIMVIDADTVLASDAIEKLLPAFDDPNVAAAGGFVLPKNKKTIWERGRYIEYIFTFAWYKFIQEYYNSILVSSGCFSAFRTDLIRENGGWSSRTIAEDMDLTWSFYKKGYRVCLKPEAVCYTTEPRNLTLMRRQIRRWTHGFVQCIRLNLRELIEIPFLGLIVSVMMLDSIFSSLISLVFIPSVAFLTSNPLILAWYFIDVPTIMILVLFEAWKRNELFLAMKCLPSYIFVRLIYSIIVLEVLFNEGIRRKTICTFEKGH